MALCDYGCGNVATVTFKNGKSCCVRRVQLCEAVKAKIGTASGATRKGMKLSDEHRRAIGRSGTGRVVSGELRLKISESNKKHWKENPRSAWNKGKRLHYDVWNKGKLKRADPKPIGEDDPIYFSFKQYRNRISYRTRRNYKLYQSEINPNNYMIGKCGVEGAYQIDHIISVRKGFELGLSVEFISAKENLQVIPWLDNIRKYDR